LLSFRLQTKEGTVNLYLLQLQQQLQRQFSDSVSFISSSLHLSLRDG